MITAGRGCIITMSSISALRGNAGQTAYSASKAALGGLVRSLSKETGMFNVRVNNIAPGLIKTEMISSLNVRKRKLLIEQTALKKAGSVDDISQMVSFLLGEEENTLPDKHLR